MKNWRSLSVPRSLGSPILVPFAVYLKHIMQFINYTFLLLLCTIYCLTCGCPLLLKLNLSHILKNCFGCVIVICSLLMYVCTYNSYLYFLGYLISQLQFSVNLHYLLCHLFPEVLLRHRWRKTTSRELHRCSQGGNHRDESPSLAIWKRN